MNILFALSLASLPIGQTKPPPEQVAYKAKTLIDFSNLKITGDIVKPSSSLVMVRRGAKFKSLIRFRGDFRPELAASLDEI